MSYKNFLKKLESIMDIFQAEAELNLILESVGFSKKDFIMGKDFSVENEEKVYSLIKNRVETQKPIQYLLGYGYFMGEKFEVNSDVLIPRPETELLVQKILELEGSKILDIGTGSGCIATMLKKLSGKEVWACDISQKALDVAQKNAENLSVSINFVHSDLFSNIIQKFDIIVSNPPYIPAKELPLLQKEVALHEPHLALFSDDEHGLDFYKKIIKDAPNYLTMGGYLIFEIGKGQHNKIVEIFNENNFKNIQVIKDFSNIERIVLAQT